MKNVYLILSSQEYDYANHKDLWHELADAVEDQVIVVNIPADQVISRLKGKKERISDAKQGARIITKNLMVIRPMFFIRPEILPSIFRRTIAKKFWACIRKSYLEIDKCNVYLLIYNPCWIRFLKGTHRHLKIGYYLYDEFRYRSSDGRFDKKAYKKDDYACRNSDVIFAMSKKLAESRSSYGKKTVVIGNGACVKAASQDCKKIKNSVAFIGNFRDWIDQPLLEGVIKKCQDKCFIFVGPIQPNMKNFMLSILNNNKNTFYYGMATKEDIWDIYRMVECVIVPYKANEFMSATRPIKIVEAVLAGTPVVTIPMDGYQETAFIRYARDIDEFAQQIDWVAERGITANDISYQAFVNENTWKSKALLIVEAIGD